MPEKRLECIVMHPESYRLYLDAVKQSEESETAGHIPYFHATPIYQSDEDGNFAYKGVKYKVKKNQALCIEKEVPQNPYPDC